VESPAARRVSADVAFLVSGTGWKHHRHDPSIILQGEGHETHDDHHWRPSVPTPFGFNNVRWRVHHAGKPLTHCSFQR